jgi:hypothetical protein
MYPLLAVLVVAAQMLYYEAKVTTFGCNSKEEVSELQRIRTDEKAFQTELVQQIFYGQCVEIPKGKLVEGSVDAVDSSMLQVDRQILPPGYLAPLDDFELKAADGKE